MPEGGIFMAGFTVKVIYEFESKDCAGLHGKCSESTLDTVSNRVLLGSPSGALYVAQP